MKNGVLTIQTDRSGCGYGLATAAPGHTTQTWSHAYFEASIQFDPTDSLNAGGHSSVGGNWPDFYSESVEHALQNVIPWTELDFMEASPNPSSYSAVTLITTIHQWTYEPGQAPSDSPANANNVPAIPVGTDFSQFHTYGLLWQPGLVSWYFDDSLVTSIPVGSGTPFTTLEQEHLYLILGTGINWPMQVKYVRVWQSP